MTRILFILLFFSLSFSAFSQRYMTTLGVRLGKQQDGVALKQRIGDESTLQGIFAGNFDEFSLTTLYAIHNPVIGRRFNFYYGGGAHTGYHIEDKVFYGFNGIMGIEYKFPLLPVLIELDFMPAFHFNHHRIFTPGGAFSISYVLKKQERKGLRGIFRRNE